AMLDESLDLTSSIGTADAKKIDIKALCKPRKRRKISYDEAEIVGITGSDEDEDGGSDIDDVSEHRYNPEVNHDSEETWDDGYDITAAAPENVTTQEGRKNRMMQIKQQLLLL